MTTKLAFNPALEAAKAKARELAAVAAPIAEPTSKPKALVQVLVRLSEPARDALRETAWREKSSVQAVIERYALGLAKVK